MFSIAVKLGKVKFPTLYFGEYNTCNDKKCDENSCELGSLYWKVLSCCVPLEKYPTIGNCHKQQKPKPENDDNRLNEGSCKKKAGDANGSTEIPTTTTTTKPYSTTTPFGTTTFGGIYVRCHCSKLRY